MSIAQDAQAMQAKLQGNTQALQAMAAEGNMAALLALKEMLESRQYAQAMKANSNMQIPELDPVLTQLTGRLQETEPQREFADAGMADTNTDPSAWRIGAPALVGGAAYLASTVRDLRAMGVSAADITAELARRMPKTAQAARAIADAVKTVTPELPKGKLSGLGALGALGTTAFDAATTDDKAYRKRFGMDEPDEHTFAGDLGVRALGAASDLGDALTFGYASKFFRDKQEERANPKPAKAGAAAATTATPSSQARLLRQQGAGDAVDAEPKQSGLAAAVGAGTPKPQDTGPVPPVAIIPLPPPDATESELAAYQAQLAQFAEDRKALSAKQREMLDAQYARQAKSMTPDKGQRFWDFLANVGAVGGKNAARALAKGAVATRDAEVKRKASMEMLKAAHEKELLLLDNADQADKEGNAAKAYQLRQEAAKVKLEREKVQSTMQENASQGRLRDAQIQETNARIPLLQAQAENQRAQTKGEGRWAPKAAGALKTPTPAQRVSWIAAEKERLRKASSAPDVTDAELERQASVNVNARIATATGAAAPADGGTPARTRIKFGDL